MPCIFVNPGPMMEVALTILVSSATLQTASSVTPLRKFLGNGSDCRSGTVLAFLRSDTSTQCIWEEHFVREFICQNVWFNNIYTC